MLARNAATNLRAQLKVVTELGRDTRLQLAECNERSSAPEVPTIQKRQRPVRPGLVIGAGTDPPSRGVLTAFVTDRRTADPTQQANQADQTDQTDQDPRKTYLLTMPWVLSKDPLEKGRSVYQPALVAGKKPDEADLIAKVSHWVEPNPNGLNHATGVIAEVTLRPKAWSPNVYSFGPIDRLGTVREGSYVQIVGASAILKAGRVLSTGNKLIVGGQGRPDKVAKFANLIYIVAADHWNEGKHSKFNFDDLDQFSQPEDSGAPVLTPQGELVGVVMAGGTDRNDIRFTWAFPIGSVLDALQVELTRPPAQKNRARQADR